MTKFPFDYVVKYDTKQVWIVCESSITAMGIQSLVDKYFPGYTGHIASQEYLNTLKQKYVYSQH
jgi:hypothetical protein